MVVKVIFAERAGRALAVSLVSFFAVHVSLPLTAAISSTSLFFGLDLAVAWLCDALLATAFAPAVWPHLFLWVIALPTVALGYSGGAAGPPLSTLLASSSVGLGLSSVAVLAAASYGPMLYNESGVIAFVRVSVFLCLPAIALLCWVVLYEGSTVRPLLTSTGRIGAILLLWALWVCICNFKSDSDHLKQVRFAVLWLAVWVSATVMVLLIQAPWNDADRARRRAVWTSALALCKRHGSSVRLGGSDGIVLLGSRRGGLWATW